MKKSNLITYALIFVMLTQTPYASASSAGDDGSVAPPPAGGSGGGSPNFYDYFIPLVFGENNTSGKSEVSIWIPSPSLLITSFQQDSFGSSISQFNVPVKLVFNPEDNLGLTNGSLIRTTSPALVVGQRITEDILSDNSFSYSILPRRMMGFEYYAPFDGYISLISLNPATRVNVQNLDGTFVSEIIDIPGNTVSMPVKQGAYINSTFPTNGAFYSNSEGTSASMAVPRYFQGSLYAFDSDLTSPREEEIDRSYIVINPSEPTEIEFTYKDGKKSNINIFGLTQFDLDKDIVSLESNRGKIEVNLRLKYDYGGLTRVSTVQLISITEMRAGEIFLAPSGYSNHFTIGKPNTNSTLIEFNNQLGGYINRSRRIFINDQFDSWSIKTNNQIQLFLADDYMFGISVSPGEDGHPMSPSAAFLNIPLNPTTIRNITGIDSTWYRFANLAVTNVEIVPGPIEEYTGQTIKVEITANGSLPSSAFNVEIIIDDELIVEDRFDFLQVNETIEYSLRLFLPYGKKKLNITISVDTDNEVSEINEDDNYIEIGFNVIQNIRLRWSGTAIILVFLSLSLIQIRKLLRRKRQINRAHVDAILSFEEA